MFPKSTLSSWGLTPVDIDDLEKDESIRHIVRLRDLIMSLYLRAVHSEQKSNDLLNKNNICLLYTSPSPRD